MGRAIIELAPELLVQALRLPGETRILAASFECSVMPTIKIAVAHEDLPEVPEGQSIPTTEARFSERNTVGAGVKEVIFCGWGENPKEKP